MAEQVVDINRIIVEYDNGTTLSVSGEEAKKVGQDFFSQIAGKGNLGWDIVKGKPPKPTVGIASNKEGFLKYVLKVLGVRKR